MNATQAKVSAVLLSLFVMFSKQLAIHGKLDPIALGEWVVANWDVLFAGLVVGWTFLRSRWLVKAAPA
jgi:hypothetical protein